MRNYIYVWNNSEDNFLVASGIEFKDFKDIISGKSNLLFLDHLSENLQFDQYTGFDYTHAKFDDPIWKEDVHCWGNCTWVDFTGDVLPKISDSNISELLFFKHKVKPLKSILIGELENKFLAFSHDDGFFLKLYYSSWNHVGDLISLIQNNFEVDLDTYNLRNGNFAFWIERSQIEVIEKTMDIDSILNSKLGSKKRKAIQSSFLKRLFKRIKIV